MLSKRQMANLLAVMGILAWMILLITNVLNIINESTSVLFGYSGIFSKALLILIFLFSFAFYRLEIGKSEVNNINDLIWKIFVTGLIASIGSLITRYLLMVAQYKPAMMNKILTSVIYDINSGLLIIFLTSTFAVWKRLILYQKSKSLLRTWNGFEFLVIISLVLTFTDYHLFDSVFNVVLIVFIILEVILSVNLKWVAYLNFKQKWKSILLIGLIALYLWYYFITITDFSERFSLSINLADNVTILSLFAFSFIYAVFSILVLLFNLPTSSVFEQKLEEVINFQRLSQTTNTQQDEEQVYETLLESSVSAVLASAAWLQISDHGMVEEKTLYHKIGKTRKDKLEAEIRRYFTEKQVLPSAVRTGKKSQIVVSLKEDEDFRSAMIFPLFVQGKKYGELCLLKDLPDGFNKEMVEIIRSFVNQAITSVENYQLIQEAIENERYKEELEIAKRVQGSLLPEVLDLNDDFSAVAFSKAAAEVGGDYYDSYRIDENRVAYIIGDVSGKGTSAAFHMSQMKGIFQSLSLMGLSVKDFVVRSNKAISNCLDRKSLITMSYFIIDKSKKTVVFSRAGHCPTLYYHHLEKRAEFFETDGLGLGILRNDKFADYVEIYEIKYKPGDIIFLYTDGITEAKNKEGMEFGYEKLAAHLEEYGEKPLKEIENTLIQKVYDFCGSQTPEDDFTTVIIKFEEFGIT